MQTQPPISPLSLEDLADQYLAQLQAGLPPDRAAFTSAYPDRADQLDRRLAVVEQLHLAIHGSTDSAPLSPVLGGEGLGVRGAAHPETIARYTILSVLGRGASGTVYHAYDPKYDRDVALKLLHADRRLDPQQVERFQREARIVAQLRHPNIVPLHEAGEHDGRPYFDLMLVHGETLEARLTRAPLTPRESAEVVRQLADALDYAHRQGIIHRDVKPANILLDDLTPQLTDFGLARRTDAEGSLTEEGALVGTVAYMSPEQAQGGAHDVDGRSDVYSLGVVLYRLLTGRLPYPLDGSLTAQLYRIVHTEPTPLRRVKSELARDLETICLKALAKEPGDRFPTAAAVAEELRRWLHDEPLTIRPMGRAEQVWRWCRRNPAVASLTTAIALTLVVGTGISSFFAYEATQRANEAADRLYVADMRLCRQAWDGAGIEWLHQLLERHRPERSWEWHYWYRLCHSDLNTLTGHASCVVCVAYSPNGQQLASGSDDGTVRIWDAVSGAEIQTLTGHAGSIRCVAFSPDGRRLASAGVDKTARLWDAASGQELRTLTGHTSAVIMVAFSPDSARLTSMDHDGTMKVWDAVRGEELPTFSRYFGRVGFAAHSPDGRHLALAGQEDGTTVRTWDIPNRRESRSLQTGTSKVAHLALSPDGNWLASVSRDDRLVKIWDPTAGGASHTLQGHNQSVDCVAFSSDSKRLASGSKDTTVKVWDVTSGALLRTFRGHVDHVRGVAFSPDGKQLASACADKTVKVWDVTREQESLVLQDHKRPVHGVAFSPDGRLLASSGGESAEWEGEVRVWDLASSLPVRDPGPHRESVNWVAFSPDGRKLAWTSGTNRGVQANAHDYDVRILEVVTGKQTALLKGHTHVVWWVAFSPDGTRLATGSEDGTVRIWDAQSGQPQHTLRQPWALGVSFSPDGRRLASGSGSGDFPVKIWDVRSGQEQLALKGHTRAVWCVTFSPDGQRLASCGNDATVRIWDALSGKEIHTLKGHFGPVSCVAFSPDGKRLASAGWDHTVKLWDPERGEEMLSLTGHASRVFSVAFSPDGHRLASGSHDKTIRIWDARPLVSDASQKRSGADGSAKRR